MKIIYILLLFALVMNKQTYADNLPQVEKIGYGEYKLILSEKQQSAVDDYLKENPQMRLMLTDEANGNIKGDIEYYMDEGTMQHQYAAWGDFNKDSYTDLLLIFNNISKKENEFHPKGYAYYFIVYECDLNDQYKPRLVHVHRDGIIDGVLYHRDFNAIEFSCFGVASGSIEWDGTDYIIEEAIGD